MLSLTFRVLLAFCNMGVGVGVSIILTGEDRVWQQSRCHLLSNYSEVYEGGDVYVFHACMYII